MNAVADEFDCLVLNADVPVVRAVATAGPEDPVFDVLVPSGPPVLVLLAVLGRSVVTVGVVAAYLGGGRWASSFPWA